MTKLLTRRAQIGPSTLDVAARTAEATIASNTPVQRSGQRPDGTHGPWIEVLDLDGANLERLIGAPVLVDHAHHRSEARVGAIEGARREGNRLVARLRFSQRPDVDALLVDLRDGIAGAISVGYTVEEWSTS
jgi:hypothetical protein